MSTKCLLSLALFAGSTLWAADYTPLDVKPGEWETTSSAQMSGTPPIPQEMLDKMTPEQRARLETALKGRGARPTTGKSCVKKEDIQKPMAFAQDRKFCKPTIVSSSSSKAEIRIDCLDPESKLKATGILHIEATSSESVKTSAEVDTTDAAGHIMHVSSSATGKWLGATCDDAK